MQTRWHNYGVLSHRLPMFPWNKNYTFKTRCLKHGLLTLVLLCPDIYGAKDVLDQYKYHLILIK